MSEWWWWWVRHKKWKLEKRRIKALLEIAEERLDVELMAQRPRRADDIIDTALLEKVLKCISEIEVSAKQAAHIDELEDLSGDAELQGQFRAYLCPVGEIQDEGELVIDLIEEWAVPKTAIKNLRDLRGKKLADTNPETARSALHALFYEHDTWADYTDEYEDQMKSYARCLSATAIILPFLAVIAFHSAFRFSPLLVLGLLLAGAAGSCVSVLAKMPAMDVALSAELDAYERRIFSRIAVGVGASLIGCAMLGWGLFPISIQNQTFADALNVAARPTSAAGIKTLILLGVPMLLGFSERALTSFEQRMFGNTKGVAKIDHRRDQTD
jgi:hypothetical protein